MIIHRVIRKLISIYQKTDEKYICSQLGSCGENSSICYPAIISHGESIFLGNNTQILAYSRLQTYPQLTNIDAHICIGNNCFIGYRFCALGGANIIIGDNNTFASNVCVVSENHGFDPKDNMKYGDQPLQCAPVYIGEGCWIGEQVIILPGVSIGRKCVIGAGCIVTKNIPDYSIAVGNPARVVKRYNISLGQWEETGK